MPSAPKDDLVRPDEAARIIRQRPTTLATWRAGKNKKGPPFFKLGRTIFYSKATRKLRIIAAHLIVSNRAHVHALPPSGVHAL